MSQVQIAAKRSVVKRLAFEVEKLCGAESAITFLNAKAKVVEAKLEMVRAARLLQHRGIIRRFCWPSRLDRIQRGEIERRLQRRFG